MLTALVTSAGCDEHTTGQHIDGVDRRLVPLRHLEETGLLAKRPIIEPDPATDDDLTLVHAARHVIHLGAIAAAGGGWVEADTVLASGSDRAARLSAGAAMKAVDLALGEARRAFALIRPPGHHATRARAMGFCLYNNVAIAARHALRRHGLDRVLIVDWDVHHGNGTEEAFYADPAVLFFSVHEWPFYPGSGAVTSVGADAGRGYNVNVPLPGGTGMAGYHTAFETVLRPLADRFEPQLVLVSAGYDAHEDDPLGRMELSTEDFGLLTDIVITIAAKHCEGRVAFVLEGGYNRTALAASVAATLRASDCPTPVPPLSGAVPGPVQEVLDEIRRVHRLGG